MKIPKLLKKIDSRVIQILVMIGVVVLFVYVIYHYNAMFRRYREVKTAGNPPQAKRPPMQVPEFFNFSPDKSQVNIESYQWFTFERKKREKLSAPPGDEGGGTGNFQVLGVVKKGRYYVVVRFDSDEKIQVFSEGMEIDPQTRVKKITTDQVVLTDPAGGERLYKVFQEEYRYTADDSAVESPNPLDTPPDALKTGKKEINEKDKKYKKSENGSGKP